MRILVADQNALLLAAIAATFGRHCEIVTATRRDACMARIEERHFDVVVACEKLADYTGLELLSEVEAVSPSSLRIFAARPESLKRLGSRLNLFGLLGTLSYPIEARKLLVALKMARGKLLAAPKPPKVRHVVLESEWDTGERLALLEHELPPEEPPVVASAAIEAPEASEVPAAADPLPAEFGAANDDMFADAPPPSVPTHPTAKAATAGKRATTPSSASASPAAKPVAATRQTAAKGPRARTPTTPTPAQREAFQRALARRNAARETGVSDSRAVTRANAKVAHGGMFGTNVGAAAPADAADTRPTPSAITAPPMSALSLQSLGDLARMSMTGRPLAAHRRGAHQPKRKVFVVGSGIAAVLLVGAVSFQLLRTSSPAEQGRHRHVVSTQLFTPNSTRVANNSSGTPQVFSAPTPQPADTPGMDNSFDVHGTPQPQTFDPDTAPPDPPPPPALEHPGPMEPPSMAHNGPPVGMQGGPDSE